MNKNTTITIIGGGIVGCAIAYTLTKNGYKNVLVIEKNKKIPDVNQSSRNAGVIHAGLYYPKTIEPLKATLCVEGVKRMYAFCKKYGIPHKKTGKLILAMNEKDKTYLEFFLKIGTENGIPGMKIISGDEVTKREPNVQNAIAALFVPSTGSVALTPLIKKIASLTQEQGGTFLLGTEVIDITAEKDLFRLTTKNHRKRTIIETEYLINAAGLYSDTIAKFVNPQQNYQILPARGELMKYDKSKRKELFVNGPHIYVTPFFYDTATNQTVDVPVNKINELLKTGTIAKTLGPHLSPAFDQVGDTYVLRNTVTVGPIKNLGLGKEDYSGKKKTAKDFATRMASFFPHLKPTDLKPAIVGIMAVLKGNTDFVIEKDPVYPRCLNLVGMDSPAVTSCFAIGEYVKNLLRD